MTVCHPPHQTLIELIILVYSDRYPKDYDARKNVTQESEKPGQNQSNVYQRERIKARGILQYTECRSIALFE